MKFVEQRITQVESLFEQYKGGEPLNLYLKKYFKKNKKFGSRDRRAIAECFYGLLRVGRENRHLSIRDRIYFYFFLKGDFPKFFFESHYPDLVESYELSFKEKLKFLQDQYELRDTFRTQEDISAKINLAAYRNSFYFEPKVFIRLRNNSYEKCKTLIEEHGGERCSEDCIAFGQNIKLEQFLEEADYVVQDLNSQRTAEYFPKLKEDSSVWDCCAGSGGKSILLCDKYPTVDLTVTDIRANILSNLIERFKLYDIEANVIAEMNVNKEKELAILGDVSFDFILCDVPCTGSGTWARTPEQFFYFEKKEIHNFHKRQLDILSNASKLLKATGALLYITCSVFAAENENVINEFLGSNPNFELEEDAYLDGTTRFADTLYVAKIKKVA